MAEFARLLKKTNDEAEFLYRAARVRKAMNEKLYDADGGYYTDGLGTKHGSVHANMFPLAFGIVPEAHRQRVVEYIRSRGMACSVYGAQYLMEAVYNAGADDYGLELMTATHDRSWFNMIKAGSTITMEAWDMKYKPNSDWNHAWGAVPANIIPRHLWGIRPGAPGYETVCIQPQLGSLKSSSIKVPTIRGAIEASYEVDVEDTRTFKIVLPGNMSGDFRMSFSPAQVVTLNGERVNNLQPSLLLKPGLNKVVVKTSGI